MIRLHFVIAALLVQACSARPPAVDDGPIVDTHVDDWRDEILYQLVTDRFANGDPENDARVDPTHPARYHGGDWRGITTHLDYLQALGVTAIWISPVVRNVEIERGPDGYHGYWALDFTRPNPSFGDRAELRALVDAAHARGLKVIVDIVTNHAGQVFFYDRNGNGAQDDGELSPPYERLGIRSDVVFPQAELILPELFRYPESYHRRGSTLDWNDREQLVYADFPGGLKDLATERSDVRQALVDVYAQWALDFNLDGYRIDTLKHVEEGFWDEFCPALRKRLAAAGKRKFFLFGEAFDGNDGILGSYTRPGRLDGVLHFSQKFQLFDDVIGGGQAPAKVVALEAARQASYGSAPHERGIGVAPRDALVGFIDNHDLPRFLSKHPGEEGLSRLGVALAWLYAGPDVPCLYYGTEQGFAGGADPANREDLWISNYRVDTPLFRRIATLARLRRELAPLRRGGLDIRWASAHAGDEPDAGILAFERSADGASVLVILNTSSHASTTAIPGGSAMTVSFAPGTVLEDRLSGAAITVGAGLTVVRELPAFGAAVFVPSGS